MKRWLAVTLLALCLSGAAWANSTSIVFTNQGGSITTSSNTLTLSNSTLTSFTGLNGIPISGTLGSVSFTTGPLSSGSLSMGGIFAAGGSFTISGNGSNGLPNGVLFQGTFNGPVNWIALYNPAGNAGLGAWTYGLAGTISGLLSNGTAVLGGTVQFTFDVPQGAQFNSRVRLKDGVTQVTVPEPGTLGLLGTGLFALAGLVRRKLSR
jgi:hypothetical protein